MDQLTETSLDHVTHSRSVKKSFNGLSPREWTLLSRSVWSSREVSSPRALHHLEHGATFSVALAERAIRIYSSESDLILDPFLGIGTTLKAAQNLNRNGIGFELYPRFAEIARGQLSQKTLNDSITDVRLGDCIELVRELSPDSVQLTFTSPPYANFIRRSVQDRQRTHKNSRLVTDNKSVVKAYGEDPRDFGNMDYVHFLASTRSIMQGIFSATKPGGFNVWVVKDCRDPQQGRPLIPLHHDVGEAGISAGFALHDLIVWDQNDQRSLVLLGYPTTFYSNINHSFLVVLRKPALK